MTLALYGKSRKRRGALLLTAFLAVLAATIGGLALIGTAFAHDDTLDGTATCVSGGSWQVNWVVTNDWNTSATLTSTVNNGATLSPLTTLPAGNGSKATATSTVSSMQSSVKLTVKAVWPVLSGDNGATHTHTLTVSRPADCATITVKKVTSNDPGATSFSADITNENGTVGAVSGATFSVAAPYTETFNANGSDDFTVTEGTLAAGWTNTGWSVETAGCPSLTSTSWKTTGSTASKSDLQQISNGDTVIVCFRNVYTTPPSVTISDNACTTSVAGSGTWHFVAPNTTKGSGGLLTVTYHFNGESVGAHTTTQAEDTGSHSNAQWFVNIAFGTHSSITIDQPVTDANGDVWDGVNGASFATMQSSSCPSATGTLKVYKLITNLPGGVTVGSNFTGTLGSYNWSAAANGTAWTQSGATLGSYTVAETGGPTTASDGGTISLVGYAPPTGGTLACPTESAAYGTDPAHTTQTLAAQGTSVFCVLNVYKAPEVITQQVTFIKYICPTAGDIPLDPAFGTAVTDDPGKCTRATSGWTFNLGSTSGASDLGKITTDGTGSKAITLNPAQLAQALKSYPNAIRVSEVLQSGYTLGSLRCYQDHAFPATDNDDVLSIASAGTSGVFCIAYNIPPPFTISTAKVVCDTEAALPDHTEGNPITSTTASAWVAASNGHCQLAQNWKFQWGYTSGPATVSDAGPAFVGAAGGNWSAPFSGSTQVTDLKGNTSLWVREVLPDGSWLPFSQDMTSYGNETNDPIGSAELACNTDGQEYDNFDRIDNVAYGKTLYCVAFNVKKTSTVDISKTDNTSGTIGVGGTFNWKLTVTVAGYQTTKASTISDPLPAGFTTPGGTINSSPTGISCTAASNVVTCTLPSGTAIGVYTITIPTTAPANGANVCMEYTNTATLSDAVAVGDGELVPANQETYLHTTASDTVSVTGCSGTIHIVKITEGVTDPHSAQFSGTIDNSQAWGPIGAIGVSGPFTVSAGDHSIQEGPASQDPTLWTPVGLAYANNDHVCPANPDNTLTMPHVDAGASVYVCVYNLRKEAQSTDGTIKLIKVVTGNNPDNTQQFPVQAGTNSGPLTNLASVTYHFAFSTDNPTVAESPVGESSVPANYQLLGYKVFSGGILSCPAVTDNSVATTVSTVGTLTIAQQTPAYTVCIYNQPNGTISVHKTTETNGIIDTNNGGWKFTVSSVACGITNVALTTDASGNASASVPACSDYVVTENTTPPPFANYTVVGSATQTGIVVPAGGTGTANFLNGRTVNSGCPNSEERCTPPPPSCTATNTCNPPLTITTPTPTPTTAVPTATPTKTVEKPANTPTASPTNHTEVLGEKTPGPGSTPVAPSTGSGFFGGSGGGFNALIAALGLLALTAGFAILGVARKERRG